MCVVSADELLKFVNFLTHDENGRRRPPDRSDIMLVLTYNSTGVYPELANMNADWTASQSDTRGYMLMI